MVQSKKQLLIITHKHISILTIDSYMNVLYYSNYITNFIEIVNDYAHTCTVYIIHKILQVYPLHQLSKQIVHTSDHMNTCYIAFLSLTMYLVNGASY